MEFLLVSSHVEAHEVEVFIDGGSVLMLILFSIVVVINFNFHVYFNLLLLLLLVLFIKIHFIGFILLLLISSIGIVIYVLLLLLLLYYCVLYPTFFPLVELFHQVYFGILDFSLGGGSSIIIFLLGCIIVWVVEGFAVGFFGFDSLDIVLNVVIFFIILLDSYEGILLFSFLLMLLFLKHDIIDNFVHGVVDSLFLFVNY